MQAEQLQDAVDLRSALASIINHHSGRWLRFIVAILKNEADAEDVLQEAVQRVIARNRRFASSEQVQMYLGRTVGNTALEAYNNRKRQRLRHVPIHEYLLLPVQTRSPYALMEERERAAERERLLGMLPEGLAQLPLKQREALRLTILQSHGLSIRDIGTTHGIPYSTLRHRSRQGLRYLRKYLRHAMENSR
jgi:RNA polymerase sigma-70 factor (ECF subfamily)